MAKSGFDLSDEQEYDVVYDDTKKKKKKSKKPEGTKENDSFSYTDNAILDNLGSSINDSNSSNDLGYFSDNVVFDDSDKTSFVDRLKSINTRMVIVIAGIALVVFVVVFMVVLSITRANGSYTAETIIPDVVYMGETSNMYVATKYSGHNKPKKDISNTENLFKSSDSNILYILNENVKGSSALNTIIPVQEGRTTVSIISKLDGATIGKKEKEVVVCRAFDASMISLKNISVTKGSRYDLKIDFGEEECGKGITYSIKDKKIATVDENGLIEGLEIGKTVLTIGRGTKSVTVTVNVTDEYVSLQSFNTNTLELQLSPGEKYRLKTDYAPFTATSFAVNYYSQNSDIVTVNGGGLVTALATGTATIKVTASSFVGDVLVNVVVKDSKNTDFATDMVLDASDVKLLQGQSRKINFSFTPNTVRKDTVKWSSSNEEIVGVTPNGVIYAKGVGDAVVTASTDNGISRDVTVSVAKIKLPTILVSDGIKSGNWHTKPFVISFLGSGSGVSYYYGDSLNNMISVANKLTISSNENKTYYIKACNRVCEQVCPSSKKNAEDSKKNCKSVCIEKPTVCSNSVVYDSMLDNSKPVITAVAGIDTALSKTDTVQIAISDTTSLVNKWCVTNKNSYGRCKWKSIEPSPGPVLEYVADSNGVYYAFARDVAGNISSGYEFEITNIG